jgi:hypothetical protein
MKLIQAKRMAARFNEDFSEGIIKSDNTTEYLLFNFGDKPRQYKIEVSGKYIDMFSNLSRDVKGCFETILEPNDAAWYKVEN